MKTLFNNTFKQNCRERKRESEDDLEEYWKRPRRFMVIKNIKNEELRFLVHWLELTKSSLRTEFCLNATTKPQQTPTTTGMADNRKKNSD